LLPLSRRSPRHIVAHSVNCGLLQGSRKARERGRHSQHRSKGIKVRGITEPLCRPLRRLHLSEMRTPQLTLWATICRRLRRLCGSLLPLLTPKLASAPSGACAAGGQQAGRNTKRQQAATLPSTSPNGPGLANCARPASGVDREVGRAQGIPAVDETIGAPSVPVAAASRPSPDPATWPASRCNRLSYGDRFMPLTN
jgi:hypothetical protein